MRRSAVALGGTVVLTLALAGQWAYGQTIFPSPSPNPSPTVSPVPTPTPTPAPSAFIDPTTTKGFWLVVVLVLLIVLVWMIPYVKDLRDAYKNQAEQWNPVLKEIIN